VSLIAHAEQRIYEGPGWDMPEGAILLYLKGLKEQDIDMIVGAYAVETYLGGLDADLQKILYEYLGN